MHILWTPSWYPTPDNEFNGSFFKDQVEILRQAGNYVGVCYLAPNSFWQWRPSKPFVETGQRMVMGSFPMVPKGFLGGDREIIKAFSKKLGMEYAKHWGAPDIVHAHSVFPGVLVAQALAQTWDIPYGVTEHRPSTLRSRENPRTSAIRKAVQSADFRLAVSQEFARELTNKYDAEFGVADLPVPDLFFEIQVPEKSDEITRFVHVSHLAPNKRVEETIRAFAEVHKSFPKTELHILGGNKERLAELEKCAAQAGVLDSVRLLGRISREHLPSVLARYDVLVLVSRREAGGTVFAEAQSLGIPVIATATFGGLHMATNETGTVVPIDDDQALVAAMEEFASKEKTFDARKIREIARNRFSSESFARKHGNTYRQALQAFSGEQGDRKCY